MCPPTRSNAFVPPSKTLRGQAARTIERVCITAARWSIPLFIPVGGLFSVYLVDGHTTTSIGIWTPRYEFLSLSEDVCFARLGSVSGFIICVGTGFFIGLAFLKEGGSRIHTDLPILSSFTGFGAGILRTTYTTVLATLI